MGFLEIRPKRPGLLEGRVTGRTYELPLKARWLDYARSLESVPGQRPVTVQPMQPATVPATRVEENEAALDLPGLSLSEKTVRASELSLSKLNDSSERESGPGVFTADGAECHSGKLSNLYPLSVASTCVSQPFNSAALPSTIGTVGKNAMPKTQENRYSHLREAALRP